jgi:hypothetical protein
MVTGQTYSDSNGEARLKAINQGYQTYKVGPIELTVKEMKMIHVRPDYSMIDYFLVLTLRRNLILLKFSLRSKTPLLRKSILLQSRFLKLTRVKHLIGKKIFTLKN